MAAKSKKFNCTIDFEVTVDETQVDELELQIPAISKSLTDLIDNFHESVNITSIKFSKFSPRSKRDEEY